MSQAIKVGAFAAIVLVVLGIFVLKIEDLQLFAPKGQRVDAVFDSVAGLDDKAAVRVAGVRVGRVDGVGLAGQRARVTLLLEEPVTLTEGSRAAIASSGLLGDKYVELILGPASAPPLPPGAVLEGTTPVSLDQAIARLDAVGQNIQSITGSLAGGGEGGGQISRLLDNLEAISADLRMLIAANRDEVSATLSNFRAASSTLAQQLPQLADRLDSVLAEIGGVVKDNRSSLQASLGNIERITAGLEPAVADLKTISGRLANGEGTIGKLLTSNEAHDQLVATLGTIKTGVDSLGETLGAAQKIKLDLGMEGFYLPRTDESQAAFQVDVRTRSDWLYRFGVVNPAQGVEKSKTQQIITTLPDGTVETTTIDTLTTEDNQLRISALLGAQLPYRLKVHTGVIESKFGLEVERSALEDRLWFALEAYDFSRKGDLKPHLRFSTRYRLHPNIYVMGGYDDPLNSDRGSLFLGAGIRWQDDDLKYLLGSVPKF